jgi:mRNA interferase RelE/StbE
VNYDVLIANRARKEMEGIPSPALETVEQKILSLGGDPRPPGCKRLKGNDRTWRVRSGNYRILFQIDDSEKTVTVIRVGHRKDIYR